MRRSITLGAVVATPFAVAAAALAGAHTWDVFEVFSNSDGTVQFVELREMNGTANEVNLNGLPVRSNATGNVFNFPGNLPGGSSANKRILLGTTAFAALPGAPTPDHIIPANFFSTSAEPAPGIEYHVYDDFVFTVGQLPLNGKDSLNRSGATLVVQTNSPTNCAGQSGSVDACPWDLDADGNVGITDFLNLLALWGNPYGINQFLALLAAWGPC